MFHLKRPITAFDNPEKQDACYCVGDIRGINNYEFWKLSAMSVQSFTSRLLEWQKTLL